MNRPTMTSNKVPTLARNNGGRQAFKKTIDHQDVRRLRDETTIQLRKNRKNELLTKRRNMASMATNVEITSSSSSSSLVSSTILNNINPTTSSTIKVAEQIAECMKVFHKWFQSNQQQRNDNNAATVMDKNVENSLELENELIEVAKTLRRLIVVDTDPPVQSVISSGAIFFLIELLKFQHKDPVVNKTNPVLLFEATWAITNIASTDYTSYIVEQYPHVINLLGELLYNDSPQVREQGGWCLGNISGDKIKYRDAILLNERIVNGYILNIQQPHSISLLKNICWSISNLCRGKPQSSILHVRRFINPLCDVIKNSIELYKTRSNSIGDINDGSKQNNDTTDSSDEQKTSLNDMIADAFWCLTYISDGDNSRIQIVLEETNTTELVCHIKDIFKLYKKEQQQLEKINNDETNNKFLDSKNLIDRTLLIPCVRCLGNLVSGTNEHTSIVVNTKIIKYIPKVLENPSKALRKEVCWMLSNVAAGTEDHIWSIFEASNCDLIRSIIKKASGYETMNVRKEAIWTICNIFTTGNTEQIQFMLQCDIWDPLCSILTYREDARLLLAVMDALEVIFKRNEVNGTMYHHRFEEFNGVEALEDLQDHPSNDVYTKAVSLIEKYFGGVAVDEDDDDFDQNVMPPVATVIKTSESNLNSIRRTSILQNEEESKHYILSNNINADTTFDFSVPKQLFPPDHQTNHFFADSSSHNNNNKYNNYYSSVFNPFGSPADISMHNTSMMMTMTSPTSP